MAISAIALFVALGGTSFAAVKALAPSNSVGSAQVINHSLKTVDLSRPTVSALRGRRGLRGAQGPAGARGVAGPAGPPGSAGATGAAGTARAYAEVVVLSGPSFVAVRTKNFTAVTRPSTGTYCLTPAAGIDARAVATVASEDFELSSVDGVATVVGSGVDCAAGQFQVITIRLTGGLVNTIGFDLIVP